MNKIKISGKQVVGALVVSFLLYLLVTLVSGGIWGCGHPGAQVSGSAVSEAVTAPDGVGNPAESEDFTSPPVPQTVTSTTMPQTQRRGPGSFTHLITDLDKVYYIIPVGSIGAPGHIVPSDHMYLTFREPSEKIDVYIPGEGIITSVRGSDKVGENGKPLEYMISFKYSDTFSYYLGHIRDLEPWLMSQVGDLRPDEWRELSIPVQAGIKLGKAGGIEGLYAFDWGVINKEIEVKGFIHQENFHEGTLYGDSPLRYCTEPTLSQYLAVVHDPGNPNKYGQIGFDQPGKLIGVWFSPNIVISGTHHWTQKQAYSDKTISFVYDSRRPNKRVIGLGGELGMIGRFSAPVGEPFENISKASGLVSYDLYDFFSDYTPDMNDNDRIKGRILVQLVASERLKVEVSIEAITEFSDRAIVYTR